jgi:hypothetical protein
VAYVNYLEGKELDARMRQAKARRVMRSIDPLLVEAFDSAMIAEAEKDL